MKKIILNTDLIYPVGSIYTTINNTNPATLFGGTWEKIASGRTLFGSSNDEQLGTKIDSGLPNIKGQLHIGWHDNTAASVPFYDTSQGALFGTSNTTVHYTTATQSGNYNTAVGLDASRSNSIYGKSEIVQPPAVYVNFWVRVS